MFEEREPSKSQQAAALTSLAEWINNQGDEAEVREIFERPAGSKDRQTEETSE